MPRKRTNELVQGRHFRWRIYQRGGMWQADGRSNAQDVGRHSLGTDDRSTALQLVHDLDATIAVQLGKAPRSAIPTATATLVTLEAGRQLFEEHLRRPRVIGGVKKSTQKRNKAVFDKFIPFAKAKGVLTWNHVSGSTLNAYATHLEDDGYAPKTIRIELTAIVQAHKWLRTEKHLLDVEPLRLTIRKQESQRAYCYRREEVDAMLELCRSRADLAWLEAVIIGLACTGLRISELASLRWTDFDFKLGMLTLTDESGQAQKSTRGNRELKSSRSRKLPIHPVLHASLKTLSRQDQYVYHGPRGGRLKPDTVRQILVREVIQPLAARFPSLPDEQGFEDGRLHSFRHYFVSVCANNNTPERVTMEWLGHKDSEMVRHYYHLHDEEARRQMEKLDLIGRAGNQLPGDDDGAENNNQEVLPSPERTGRHRS